MDKFNPEAKCVKCGCGDIAAKLVCAGEYRFYPQPANDHGFDVIDRHCRRCGYRWEEAALDQDTITG